MKFNQTTPTGSDETAGFDVEFSGTVGELIEEILTRKEWGTIEVNGRSIKYKQNLLFDTFPPEVMRAEVVSLTSVGGWSLMSYRVTVK